MDTLWSLAPLLLAFFSTLIFVSKSFTRKGTLPPGPPRLPVLGNLLQLTESESIWRPMTTWGQKYGPIISLSALGQPLMVLNSHKVASDLLDRRSSIYSDRPGNIVVGELLTKGYLMAITRYGDLWRRMRRAAHEAVGPHIYKEYFPQLEVEASVLVSTLLDSPDDFFNHIRRATTSLMLSLIYGLPPILDSKDPRIVWIEGVAQRLGVAARPGAYYVEFLTWMMYLPRWMCRWRTDAERWHVETSAKYRELLDGVAAREKAGSQQPCISTRLLQECSKGNLSLDETTWTAGTLYLAGAETTGTTMLWFMQAMLLHPSAQLAAQEELDRVVGKSRMPTFRDFDNLPYIQAIVKEVLRWRPVLPLGVPHRLDKEDTYLGYQIPKDSIVIANAWGLNQDPDVYGDDAHKFKPERYLNSAGNVVTPASIDTKDEGHVTYGFGRRLCVGRYVANSNVFIQAASILWALRILPEHDNKGEALLPDVNKDDVDGLLLAPPKFRCRFVPRSDEVLAIVQSTKEERMSGSKQDV
ncbi:hypothetical protein ONZ45_g9710 [Pleurotus djamor]|nr:hypothetical protein ONZ45_g9710 [Pleurotus djamor]